MLLLIFIRVFCLVRGYGFGVTRHGRSLRWFRSQETGQIGEDLSLGSPNQSVQTTGMDAADLPLTYPTCRRIRLPVSDLARSRRNRDILKLISLKTLDFVGFSMSIGGLSMSRDTSGSVCVGKIISELTGVPRSQLYPSG